MKVKKTSAISITLVLTLTAILILGVLSACVADTQSVYDNDYLTPYTSYVYMQDDILQEDYTMCFNNADETSDIIALRCYDMELAETETSTINATEFYSPFVIATTPEEVRAIQARDDTSIFVTNVALPTEYIYAVRRGQMNGIIVRNQDPNQSLEDIVDILNDFLLHGQLFSYVVLEGFLAPFPTEEERLAARDALAHRLEIIQKIMGDYWYDWMFGEPSEQLEERVQGIADYFGAWPPPEHLVGRARELFHEEIDR